MPLTIQLPAKAPISNRMMMATETPKMLLQMAVSMAFQETRQQDMANTEQTAVDVSRTI